MNVGHGILLKGDVVRQFSKLSLMGHRVRSHKGVSQSNNPEELVQHLSDRRRPVGAEGRDT